MADDPCDPALSAANPTGPRKYYRARYYDPKIGRFLSEDPIRFLGGINFYAYARNRPVNLRDPWGLQSVLIPVVTTVTPPEIAARNIKVVCEWLHLWFVESTAEVMNEAFPGFGVAFGVLEKAPAIGGAAAALKRNKKTQDDLLCQMEAFKDEPDCVNRQVEPDRGQCKQDQCGK